MSIRLQLTRIAAHWSQTLNVCVCWVFGQKWAHHDLTISARAYIEEVFEDSKQWARARRVIDWIFLHTPLIRQADHCRLSYIRDLLFSAELPRHPTEESKCDAPPQ